MSLKSAPLSVIGWLVGLVAGWVTVCSSHAAEKKYFDLPADLAARSIKIFAQQSGAEVLMSARLGRKIHTQAVKGEHTPLEAVALMFSHTQVVVQQDSATGVMTITLKDDARDHPGSDPPPAGQQILEPKKESSTMRTKNPIALLIGWAALALSPERAAVAAEGFEPATGSISGRVQNVVTRQYLNNARISVRGTDLIAFTDQSGTYRINQVPVGAATIEVFYTGLDPQQIPLSVLPNQVTEQNVDLTSVARYGQNLDAVRLDSFLVSSSRETDAEAIAINEQRFAANIKNVVTTDAFGDVMGGNVGEFLKLLPGVFWADTSQPDVQEVSVRGLASHMTSMSVDGAQLASAPTTSTQRAFQVRQVSINNIARVEVTKVPTPSSRADSMAGSINMVSKSAFERKTAQLRWSVNLTSNSELFSLKKTSNAFEKDTYKVFPGFEFDYTLPINANLGLVITGQHSGLSNPQDFSNRTYTGPAATVPGSSFARPFMNASAMVDAYRYSQRDSFNVKVDWRPFRYSVLSVGLLTGYNRGVTGNYTRTINAGANGTPTITGGTSLTYGPDFTHGATGRGTVTMVGPGLNVQNSGAAVGGNLQYRFDDGTWRIEAGLATSTSRFWRPRADEGFQNMTVGLAMPVRVNFTGINDLRAGQVQVFDNNNQEVDIYNVNNYTVTEATDMTLYTRDSVNSGRLDLRRSFSFWNTPLAVQVGGARNQQERDILASTRVWSYNPPGGNRTAAPYQAVYYSGESLHYDPTGRPMPWISPMVAWRAWQANPGLFSQTPIQVRNTVQSAIRGSRNIEETVDALYFQVEGRFLRNRLQALTGVRYERTRADAFGPLQDLSAIWVRNPDGSFARSANGQRIRRPEAGAANSLEELHLTEKERAFHTQRSYDGFYPSLHLNFNATENFLIRAAYAKSYGRPDFADILPTLVANEFDLDDTADPTLIRGTINVSNTGLLPWTADNYDLSLEYYTRSGGVISGGAFLKEIENFFGTLVTVATAEDLDRLGLDPRYVGWQINTRINAGNARISGVEFNLRQSLAPLGGWGRYFSVFANGTKLKLEGPNGADFRGFIPKSLNWGATFTKRPVTLSARWSYLGKNRTGPIAAAGPDAYAYAQFARPTLDLSFSYQLPRGLTLFANVKNITNEPRILYRYGSDTPDYARVFQTMNYGSIFSIGIKGVF